MFEYVSLNSWLIRVFSRVCCCRALRTDQHARCRAESILMTPTGPCPTETPCSDYPKGKSDGVT